MCFGGEDGLCYFVPPLLGKFNAALTPERELALRQNISTKPWKQLYKVAKVLAVE